MSTCSNLDPRVIAALHWAGHNWHYLVMGALALVIVALWRHGR